MTPTTPTTPAPAQAGRRSDFGRFQLAAIGFWSIGVGFTYLFLSELSVNLPWWLALGVAATGQWLLTTLQSDVWRGRFSASGGLALLFDAALNAGGIYPLLARLHETPTAEMLASAQATDGSPVAPVYAILIAFVLGALVAGAPEELWRRR